MYIRVKTAWKIKGRKQKKIHNIEQFLEILHLKQPKIWDYRLIKSFSLTVICHELTLIVVIM